MSNTFVYITKKEGECYSLRSRENMEDYLKDLDDMGRVGYSMVKSFRVPNELAGPVIGACSEFIKGNLSLDDLEIKVEALSK